MSKYVMTLKSRSKVTRGHRNRYKSIRRLSLPINRVRTIPVLGIGRYLRVSVLGDTVFSTHMRYFHSRYTQAPPIVQ